MMSKDNDVFWVCLLLQSIWACLLNCQAKEYTHTSVCVLGLCHVSCYHELSLLNCFYQYDRGRWPTSCPLTFNSFPTVRRQYKHTIVNAHSHSQRRSLSCPGWTGAEVLQNDSEGKWRSFDSETKVILVLNLKGLNDHSADCLTVKNNEVLSIEM